MPQPSGQRVQARRSRKAAEAVPAAKALRVAETNLAKAQEC